MYVYILASKRNGTLYIGVMGDLVGRIWEHRENLVKGFTNRYEVKSLVHFEQYDDPQAAIQREKNLKKWSRKWKLELIEAKNPDWRDQWEDITS